MTTSPIRRTAALLTTLVALGAGLAAAPAHAQLPAGGAASTASAARVAPTTTLTFALTGCRHCRITLHQAIEGRRHVWETKAKRARGGEVTFTVPTRRTHGLDATIRAPWEGANGIPTGYVSQVVFRYAHQQPGSVVTFDQARRKHHASACWAGTRAAAVTIPVRVRKVRVGGTTGRTNGTLAWTKPTQDFWKPMERTADKGIFGTQDVPFCQRP